eukprot:7546750-Alexandrium_andersonii.AAC.1
MRTRARERFEQWHASARAAWKAMHDQDRGADMSHLGTVDRPALCGHRLFFALRSVAQKLSDRAEVEA